MRALIIDLRGNPGGSLEAAIQVVERFVPDGVIVCTQSRVGQYCRTYRAHNSNAWGIPLVVLINPGTASAAEVAAGAWKDRQRATLVGEPTFGKACIQGVLPLDTVPSGERSSSAACFWVFPIRSQRIIAARYFSGNRFNSRSSKAKSSRRAADSVLDSPGAIGWAVASLARLRAAL